MIRRRKGLLIAGALLLFSCSIDLFGLSPLEAQQGQKPFSNSPDAKSDRKNRLSEFNDLSSRVLKLIDDTEYTKALELAQRALQIAERDFKPNDDKLANIRNSLGVIYKNLGKYALAEQFLLSARAIWEKNNENLMVAYSNNNLGTLYAEVTKLDEAERFLKAAVDIRKSLLGERHPLTIASLHNLGLTLVAKGNFSEGEDKIRQAIQGRQALFGTSHALTLSSIAILGYSFIQESRLDEANEVYTSLIESYRNAGLTRQDGYFGALNNFAFVLMRQGSYQRAKQVLSEVVTLQAEKYGTQSLFHSVALTNLGRAEYLLKKYLSAKTTLDEAFAIQVNQPGLFQKYAAINRNNVGKIYLELNDIHLALASFQQALDIGGAALDSRNIFFADVYRNRALALARKGDLVDALEQLKKALSFIPANNASQVLDIEPGFGMSGSTYDDLYADFISISKKLFDSGTPLSKTLLSDSFEISQLASSSKSSAALFLMSARFASDDSTLSKLIRTRQDMVGEWHSLNRRIISGFSRVSSGSTLELEREQAEKLTNLRLQIEEIEKQIAKIHPKFAELITPQPLDLSTTQKLLREDEVLVDFHVGTTETSVWFVGRDEVRWATIELSSTATADMVKSLRCGLDDQEWQGVQQSARCGHLLGLAEQPDRNQPLPFSFSIAYELYKRVFLPAEDLIKNKHLLIVQSGPLAGLPLQVLVTKPPKAPLGLKYEDYRDIAWLVKSQAITVLPSVASLRWLRTFAKGSTAFRDYIGFGDPVLQGDASCRKGVAPTTCMSLDVAQADTSPRVVRGRFGLRSGNLNEVFQNGAGPELVRAQVRALCPLPDTAFEIKCVAQSFGASQSELHLGEEATKATLKSLSDSGELAGYRVVHFATHGLVAGDMETIAKRQGEPALVMTPPLIPKDVDDNGLLTASEVTQLKLNADWVILSACNTAAGENLGAEALSGLTRAFFYAGARALLVSHWPVYSDAAVQLVNGTFEQMRKDQIGRAEALRRAMVAFIEDTTASDNSHPAVWAPFIVVGEGGS